MDRVFTHGGSAAKKARARYVGRGRARARYVKGARARYVGKGRARVRYVGKIHARSLHRKRTRAHSLSRKRARALDTWNRRPALARVQKARAHSVGIGRARSLRRKRAGRARSLLGTEGLVGNGLGTELGRAGRLVSEALRKGNLICCPCIV
jgi:hypothetical protein